MYISKSQLSVLCSELWEWSRLNHCAIKWLFLILLWVFDSIWICNIFLADPDGTSMGLQWDFKGALRPTHDPISDLHDGWLLGDPQAPTCVLHGEGKPGLLSAGQIERGVRTRMEQRTSQKGGDRSSEFWKKRQVRTWKGKYRPTCMSGRENWSLSKPKGTNWSRGVLCRHGPRVS